MTRPVPEWCEVRRGTGTILLVAPHGGRRPPVDALAPPANLRVNDVFTPEVTRALAARLGAGSIINTGIDRNRVDLNRISQVRRHAPWFLDLVAAEVAFLLDRHGRAEVVFVHGWNDGQLKCDIGLGGVERDGDVAPPPGRRLSVSPEYLRQRVAALRAACARRGIAAPIGEKYPASHPNNLVQLFADPGPGSGPFVDLADDARVSALQLELTLPLRCPGPWRERFIDAAAEAFRPAPDEAAAAVAAARAPAVSRRASNLAPGGESLQFYDPTADLGLFAGLGRSGPKSVAGRLLLFLGGQRIALFTGEDGSGGGVPLHVERRGDRLALAFSGPILLLQDGAAYLDLEAALAASRTVEAELELTFEETARAAAGATHGRVHGALAIDGVRRELAAQAFGRVAALRSAGAAQTMLAAGFADGSAFLGRLTQNGEDSSAVRFRRGAAEILRGTRLTVVPDGDTYTPAAFELRLEAAARLRGEPLNRMAILRSSPRGYVRVAFGVARFEWAGLAGHGLYEHALPLAGVTPA